jgi:hypothetical protein
MSVHMTDPLIRSIHQTTEPFRCAFAGQENGFIPGIYDVTAPVPMKSLHGIGIAG